MKPKVLLIVCDPAVGETRRLLLEEQGCTVTTLVGSPQKLTLPKRLEVDAVVVGDDFPHHEYTQLISFVRKHVRRAKIIALETAPDHKLAWADGHADANAPLEWLKLVMNTDGSSH